jgi:hypothetical protein
VVGKDPVELEKYVLRKKIALPEEDISTLILFNTRAIFYVIYLAMNMKS